MFKCLIYLNFLIWFIVYIYDETPLELRYQHVKDSGELVSLMELYQGRVDVFRPQALFDLYYYNMDEHSDELFYRGFKVVQSACLAHDNMCETRGNDKEINFLYRCAKKKENQRFSNECFKHYIHLMEPTKENLEIIKNALIIEGSFTYIESYTCTTINDFFQRLPKELKKQGVEIAHPCNK